MIKINLIDEVGLEKEQIKVLKKVLRLAHRIVKPHKSIINVILVDDATIHQLNLQYREIDRPTDVLSFENTDPGKEMGDVFISIDKAKAQAEEYGHSLRREIAFLSCHGYLHCNGYDHHTPEEEQVMFALQDQILNKAKITR